MKPKQRIKIIFVGGSTAGHTLPAILLWDYFNCHYKLSYRFIISGSEVDKKLTSTRGIVTTRIYSGKLRRYFSILNFFDFFKIIIGFFQSFFIIVNFSPNIVFAKGSYLSFPVVLAAKLFRIKVVCHESDKTLGLANKLNSRFCNAIITAFPKSEYPKTLHSKIHPLGIPLDPTPTEVKPKTSIQKILVMGGSQGAKTINDKLKETLPALLERFRVTHLTGKNQYLDFHGFKKSLKPSLGNNYLPISFVSSSLNNFYKSCDLVVSRGGATTLFEIANHALPAIIIPLGRDKSRGDQIENCRFFKKQNAIIVIDEKELSSENLYREIIKISQDKNMIKKLSNNIKFLAKPNATQKIADLIYYLAFK